MVDVVEIVFSKNLMRTMEERVKKMFVGMDFVNSRHVTKSITVRHRYNGPHYNGSLDIVDGRAGTEIFTCCRPRYSGNL